jgi:small subunit ribosomal protein S14
MVVKMAETRVLERETGEKSCGIKGIWQSCRPESLIMAKTSWIHRNARKQKTVNKYAKLREELKANKDYVGLSMLPRDASPTRLVNRCRISGRRRAFMRRFEMSRITFREMASMGMLPGVTKSSW